MHKFIEKLPKEIAFKKLKKTPIGDLGLLASDKGLVAVLWHDQILDQEILKELKRFRSPTIKQSKILASAEDQLMSYFLEKRTQFNLPVDFIGTDFQKKAWNQLLKIPFGKTISYREQAAGLGDPKKARAVGTANSKNPIPILVPCHRVISKSGALSGFAGGVKVKKYLLKLEGNNIF